MAGVQFADIIRGIK